MFKPLPTNSGSANNNEIYAANLWATLSGQRTCQHHGVACVRAQKRQADLCGPSAHARRCVGQPMASSLGAPVPFCLDNLLQLGSPANVSQWAAALVLAGHPDLQASRRGRSQGQLLAAGR